MERVLALLLVGWHSVLFPTPMRSPDAFQNPFFGFVFGAILGSFIATLIVRWPRRQSILSGRSVCDQCGVTLRAIALIPIVSGIALRMRCAACKGRIDPTQLQVEVAASLIGLVAFWVSPNSSGLSVAVMGWLCIPLVILDVRHFWLPSSLVMLLGAAGIIIAEMGNAVPLQDRLLAALLGGAVLWIIAALYSTLRGRKGMGSNDPWLFAAIGCWVGTSGLGPALLIGTATLLIAALIFHKNRSEEKRYPLGAALAGAGWLVFAFQTLH